MFCMILYQIVTLKKKRVKSRKKRFVFSTERTERKKTILKLSKHLEDTQETS